MRALLLFCCVLALPASAASLRPMGTLSAPVVRLSDLFDDAGDNASRILGPGPAPGERIVVEAAQLAAIARQFGVAWKPASTTDRAVLERPGRPMPRNTVIEAVRASLGSAGVAAESELDIGPFSLPLVPLETQPRAAVTQLEHDPATGNFTAILTIGGADMAPVHLRVGGRVHETVLALVPARRLLPGEVLRAEDVRLQRIRAAPLQAEVARTMDEAIGMTPRNVLAAGQPMRLTDLMRPPAVRKGSAVQMLLNGGGLSLAGQALALESGATGERVRVQNTASRAVLEATVTGPDRVRISPDSLPVQPPAGAPPGQVVLR